MVVLADRAAPGVAELHDGIVVDGHLQRIAHPLVVIGLVGDVGAGNERGRCRDLRFHQIHLVEDVDEVGRRFEIEVDLAGLEGIHRGVEVGAVVDELDTVERRFATPPFAVLAALDDRLLADVVGHQLESSGTDRLLDRVGAILVEVAMHDQRRIVGEVPV